MNMQIAVKRLTLGWAYVGLDSIPNRGLSFQGALEQYGFGFEYGGRPDTIGVLLFHQGLERLRAFDYRRIIVDISSRAKLLRRGLHRIRRASR